MRRCAAVQSAGRNRQPWWGREFVRAQGVKVRLVLTAVFDVFQARAIAKGIERDVEYMVRLMVGQVDEKQVEVTVDGIDQARLGATWCIRPIPP